MRLQQKSLLADVNENCIWVGVLYVMVQTIKAKQFELLTVDNKTCTDKYVYYIRANNSH